ncbi:MAG: hypothetical protein HQL50_09825 [Magnetococcales bacterium]|nr:hypothetical protein [Magnetococcales bacterium]
MAWFLESVRPDTPKPVLELVGEQGCGKSDTQSRLRDLIDPNDVNLRAAPRKVEDIFVGASNNWMFSLNNLSRLTAEQQDAFCTLSTGGGHASRQLYTNADESVIEVKRPVMLNGISDLATAQDLVDRTLRIELPVIKHRRRVTDMEAEFEKNRGRILGGLLDLFVKSLGHLPLVSLDHLPRMADFATLGEAMLNAMNREPGTFSRLYQEKREQSIIHALDASPVARAVQEFMENRLTPFTGTVKELLCKLAEYRYGSDGWPRSAKGLSNSLRRHAPALRVVGVSIAFESRRRRDGYHITVDHIVYP